MSINPVNNQKGRDDGKVAYRCDQCDFSTNNFEEFRIHRRHRLAIENRKAGTRLLDEDPEPEEPQW